MLELIYTSHAIGHIKHSDIDAILKVAQKYNSKHNITGCLLFYNHEFVQMLEGSEEAVVKLYARIEKDKRHFDVRLLSMTRIDVRIFSSWSMAYQKLDDKNWDYLKEVDDAAHIETLAELSSKPTVAGILFKSVALRMLSQSSGEAT